jgi:acetylornithine deacetylase/succinyl-diaminopimelate desuccinylase-like protein
MLADAKQGRDQGRAPPPRRGAWSPLLHITPRPFDPTLMGFIRGAVKQVTGAAPELPSGPLHDAAEMAGVVPTAMMFAQSSPGISHTKLEDTPRPALDKSIRAFLIAVDQTIAHLAAADASPAPRRPARRPRRARA